MSTDLSLLPPPPPPPPPLTAPASPVPSKKLYQAIAAGKSPVKGNFEEAMLLLRQRESSFRKDLQWALFNTYVPSLIQDGPKCGLVALWMAASLLKPDQATSLEKIVQIALDKGYTAQGEMFSASNMALLAEEVYGCRTRRLLGGMVGDNAVIIQKHLAGGQPILIPYDEDSNHEPCLRRGHKAHWAVASGVLLGLVQGSVTTEQVHIDPTLPWLHCCRGGIPAEWPSCAVREAYVLTKQGKSLRYQLWEFDMLTHSNAQLKEMDPRRASDGTRYVLPPGGVEEGLGGQVVLLYSCSQSN